LDQRFIKFDDFFLKKNLSITLIYILAKFNIFIYLVDMLV
jgi:hypothetical protein